MDIEDKIQFVKHLVFSEHYSKLTIWMAVEELITAMRNETVTAYHIGFEDGIRSSEHDNNSVQRRNPSV